VECLLKDLRLASGLSKDSSFNTKANCQLLFAAAAQVRLI